MVLVHVGFREIRNHKGVVGKRNALEITEYHMCLCTGDELGGSCNHLVYKMDITKTHIMWTQNTEEMGYMRCERTTLQLGGYTGKRNYSIFRRKTL